MMLVQQSPIASAPYDPKMALNNRSKVPHMYALIVSLNVKYHSFSLYYHPFEVLIGHFETIKWIE